MTLVLQSELLDCLRYGMLSMSNPPKLIPIHGHSLRVAAELAVRRRADGPAAAAVAAARSTAFLESQELLRAEGLVVDLARRFHQVLEVGASEEVSQRHEFAMVFVLHVNHTPAVLPAADLPAIDNNILFTADHSKRDDVLRDLEANKSISQKSYLDLHVHGTLLVIELVIVVRVHLQVMEGEFLLDSLLERLALLEGKRVGLGNHGNDIDDVGQLLQHNNVNGLEATPLSARTSPWSMETHAWPDGWMKNRQQWMRVSWI